MRSDLNALNAEVTAIEAEHQNVLAFLRDSQTASRTQVEQDIADARAAEAQAEADQAALREEIDPVTDRETLTLRDLLTDAERALADARNTVTSLDRQQDRLHRRAPPRPGRPRPVPAHAATPESA